MIKLHLHLLKKASLLYIKRNISQTKSIMALTKFEYVKSFEIENKLEPLHWVVLSVYCVEHKEFLKQNNVKNGSEIIFRQIMSSVCSEVMEEEKEIALGYAYSNIVHFILKRDTYLFKRREYKLLSNIISRYSSAFIRNWRNFAETPLCKIPTFNGEINLLPQDQCLRDFVTIEQRKCHFINLEETTLRNLVNIAKLSSTEALEKVKNTNEGQKNELLFSLCNINYNNEPVEAKKGAIFLRNSNDCASNSSKTEKNFKYDYLSSFKRKNHILPHTFLVVRIDGKGFSKFSATHKFEKPNDRRSLNLMNHAAITVMKKFPIIKLSYGQSDEYSFVIKRFGHGEKEGNALISRIVSVFTGSFTNYWKNFFSETQLEGNPVFDARLVLYPTIESVRDYLSWRQADCHINNMYNTCFWKLVNEKGFSRTSAQEYLKGTFSEDKQRILKEELGFIYSDDEPMFRKGSVICKDNLSGDNTLVVKHCDIIGPQFWIDNCNLLEEKRVLK
ncbi:tRNA(His) guanylyltransferase 1 [Armadillidium nasatum]|uniref:Probable tRNA(His) guanylyltransferase n=1 Tax=Armadillidium nasatum TaxID=96803 RepID=A0A5N5T9B0_9CRUS|nr:tRNA(His) guanylyltransferase 1 [Armadillidium nasatum]